MLSELGWLTRTPAPFREAVLAACDLHHFDAGATVYAQGDTGACLWGIAAGTMGVEMSSQRRDPGFAYFTGKGFWIGAQPLVMGTDRQVGLVALRPSVLLSLPYAAFRGIVQRDPEAWRWLAVLPLLQNMLAFSLLDDLMIRDTRRRCAAVLLWLAGCRGPLAQEAPEDIHVTQEQLAEMTNMSRTALGTILRDFELEGVISRRYGLIACNRRRLTDVLGGS